MAFPKHPCPRTAHIRPAQGVNTWHSRGLPGLFGLVRACVEKVAKYLFKVFLNTSNAKYF